MILDETQQGAQRTFDIVLSNRACVEEALTALAKRAARRGLTPLVWSWGKAYEQRVLKRVADLAVGEEDREHVLVRIPLTLETEPPRYSGWTFLASLEHLDGENIVREVPGTDGMPAEFRTRGPQCDHCKFSRRRADTYVLRHDNGRTIQIGSSCIGDFLGSDTAGRIAAMATLLASAGGIAEDGEIEGEGTLGGGGGRAEFYIGSFLALVACVVRTEGWVSRTAARERSIPATADRAWSLLVARRSSVKEKIEPTAEDAARASEAANWAESLTDAQVDAETGNYFHNLRAVARTGAVNYRSAGIAASIVTAYERAIGRERQRAERAARPKANKYIGTVGKRETWDVTLDFVTGYETHYGYTTILKFRTDGGEVLVWKASSSDLGRADVGKRYSLKGTVKKHEEYKGEKQTYVARCKVSEVSSGSMETK